MKRVRRWLPSFLLVLPSLSLLFRNALHGQLPLLPCRELQVRLHLPFQELSAAFATGGRQVHDRALVLLQENRSGVCAAPFIQVRHLRQQLQLSAFL